MLIYCLLHIIHALPTPQASQDSRLEDSFLLQRQLSSQLSSAVLQNSNQSHILCDAFSCVSVTGLPSLGVQTSSINETLSLLPGSYSLSSPSDLGPFGDISPFFAASLQTSSGFTISNNVTSFQTAGNTIVVGLEHAFIAYQTGGWSGSTKIIEPSFNASEDGLDVGEIQSYLVPNDAPIRAILEIEEQIVVVSQSSASISTLNVGGTKAKVLDVQSLSCASQCASGGFCSDLAAGANCTCLPGFTGPRCDECISGHFGPSCTACPDSCPTTCFDGIVGDGSCPIAPVANITVTPPSEECNCLQGICVTGGCNCNAGWTDGANGALCSICQNGYFQTTSGSCQACASGCSACSPITGVCLSCSSGLQISSTDSTTCEPASFIAPNSTSNSFTSCPTASFLDTNTQTCQECDPICSTCFGSSASQCVTCKSPRGMLEGQCVSVDQASGICDSSSLNSNRRGGTWVYDNLEQICQPLPANCTTGSIPSFSAASPISSAICTKCQLGTFLSSSGSQECGACAVGEVGGVDGKCTKCPAGCSSCTSDGRCLTCSIASQVILNGSCVSSCPSNFFVSSNNGTSVCEQCHPDCLTCSGTFNTCLTCPPSRPVLDEQSNCVLTCSSSKEYFDTTSQQCQPIHASCQTGWGNGPDQCLGCADGQVLENGKCNDANCEGERKTVSIFGVCIESLGTIAQSSSSTLTTGHTNKSFLPLLALLIIPVLLLILLLLRRRNLKRRKDKTEEFKERMESRTGRWNMRFFGLGASSKLRKKMPISVLSVYSENSFGPGPSQQMEEVPLTPRRPSTLLQPLQSQSTGSTTRSEEIFASRNPFRGWETQSNHTR